MFKNIFEKSKENKDIKKTEILKIVFKQII